MSNLAASAEEMLTCLSVMDTIPSGSIRPLSAVKKLCISSAGDKLSYQLFARFKVSFRHTSILNTQRHLLQGTKLFQFRESKYIIFRTNITPIKANTCVQNINSKYKCLCNKHHKISQLSASLPRTTEVPGSNHGRLFSEKLGGKLPKYQ